MRQKRRAAKLVCPLTHTHAHTHTHLGVCNRYTRKLPRERCRLEHACAGRSPRPPDDIRHVRAANAAGQRLQNPLQKVYCVG